MAMTRPMHAIFFLLVLMTCQENTFTEGRFLSQINKGNHNKRRIEQKKINDINSRPVAKTRVPVKLNQETDLEKPVVVQKDDTQHVALTKDSGVRHYSSGHKNTNGGNYNVEEHKQQGYSHSVYYSFVESEVGAKQDVQPNVEDKTHDYSPGVGHSVPVANEDTKPKEVGDTSIMADKRNAGGKPSDYSPGVGHSFVHDVKPESQDNGPRDKHSIQDKTQGHSPGVGHSAASFAQTATTKVWQNSDKVRDEQFQEEQLTTESHSPGVGHSIQQKKAEPRAK